jgi:hypothetical protein
MPIESSLETRTINPGESITETYKVYTDGSISTCLPSGTYRFQDKEYGRTENDPKVLTIVLRVDESQKLSATTEEPTIPEA